MQELACRSSSSTSVKRNACTRCDPQLVRGGPVVVWELLQNANDIVLTLHRVTGQLDAGAVLEQRSIPIRFRNGLRGTTKATLAAAEPVAAAMFYDVLIKAAAGLL